MKEENERLRQLLQDDFIDDPDATSDGIKPLQLPMIPMKKKGVKNSKLKELLFTLFTMRAYILYAVMLAVHQSMVLRK